MRRIITKKLRRLRCTVWKNFHQSIAHKLTALLIVMLLAVGANIVLFKWLTLDFRNMADTVSMVGKLRMLSQKIELDLLHFAADSDTSSTAVLNGVAEFDMLLGALTQGGTVFGVNVPRLRDRHQSVLDNVRQKWVEYRDEIILTLENDVVSEAAGELTSLRHQLSLRSTSLLHASEELVDNLVKGMQQRQRLATIQMYVAFVVVIVSFFLGLWFVRRRISQPLALLYDGVRRLSGGDYQLHMPYVVADDMGRVIGAFNDSAQHFGSLLHELEYSHNSLKRAETMFRGVVENSGIGVYVRSRSRFLFVNQIMAAQLGYERKTMLTELHPEDVFFEETDSKYLIENHTSCSGSTAPEAGVLRRGVCRDGSMIELEVFETVMRLDEEPVRLGVALDVTKRRKNEASARLAHLVYDVSSEGMVITGADAHIIHVNPAFTQITGYEAHEVLGKKMSLLSSGRHSASFYKAMWTSIENTGRWVGEVWNRRKNGEVFAERLSVNTSYDENGRVQYRVGLFSDITTRKKADALIWQQANFDCLTALPNRKMLQDTLLLALSRARTGKSGVALALMDLDHFKDINDTLSHQSGDELLKQTALRIKGCLRKGDTVGRLGGDEFMIIITDIDSVETADRICRRIIKVLSEPFTIHGDVVNITTSLGVTLFPQDADGTVEMFKNADMAMYEAKARGRNQYCWFTSSMQEKVALRQRMSRELSDAVDAGQFSLAYQPIIDLGTGNVCKAEALIRWNHPERGVIGPAEFIPFAEDSGVIDAIGDWVFEVAAQQAAQWRAMRNDDFQVSINVSPVQFLSDDSGLSRWLTLLEEWNLNGNSIVVEITEGLLMDACGTVTRRLRAFQDGGIQVALDDFGTGYSSLSYLKKFDIDYVKIDRSFVSNLGPDTDERVLCDAIVVMAHRLGLKVVAEGIETEQQCRLLQESGCDYGQGFLFGRPVPPEQFGQLLKH